MFLIFQKYNHTFVMLHHRDKPAQAIHHLGAWADNPELPFTWRDAAMLAKLINAKCGAETEGAETSRKN